MQISRRCNINVHRASYAKHLRSWKQLENIREVDMIVPEWLFNKEEQAHIRRNKIEKLYNPKTLKQ